MHTTSYNTTTIDTLDGVMNTVMTIYCFVIFYNLPFINITPNSIRKINIARQRIFMILSMNLEYHSFVP